MLYIKCRETKVQGDWKVTAFKTKAGLGQLCLFGKLEISAAIEVAEEQLAFINNTCEPPFTTYYGNCLKSKQPISQRHMHILKICAGCL